MTTTKILVVIPTFNCAMQIIHTLRDIQKYPFGENVTFWVIDNNSSDCTYEDAQRFASTKKLPNIRVYQTVQNNNLGGTHKIAFEAARNESFDFVGVFHGDNQASGRDLFEMIKRIDGRNNHPSLMGSRFSRNSSLVGYSKKRVFGNLLLNIIYSIASRRILTDLGSGLNIYNSRDIQEIDYLKFGNSLTFNYELILEMCRLDIPFEFVPITWRSDGQISNARNIRVFTSGVVIVLRHILRLQRKAVNRDSIYALKKN